MSRVTWTISLEPGFAKQAETARKREHRTRSEFVREAIRRSYFGVPTYTPTAAERRAIEKGRKSEPMSLDDFFTHVERLAKTSRRQDRRPRARKGA